MMKPIYYVGGNKGGVGKSFVCGALLDFLTVARGLANVSLIESDAGNPDVYKSYKDALVTHRIDLGDEEGWMDLVTTIDADRDSIVVINSAAGSNAGFARHGAILTGMLHAMKRELITLWVIDDGVDGLVSLNEFRTLPPFEGYPCKVHVILNGVKGDVGQFLVYAGSMAKKEVEVSGGRSLYFPRLASRVANEMNVKRQSIARAAKEQPMGNQAALFQWRPAVARMFAEVVDV